MELSCGFVFPDRNFFHGDDVACIELADDVHDGDAGFWVAVGDGGLDAGGAAVFWEEGGVEVDYGFFGGFADGFADDLAVGHDDNEVWGEVGEFSGGFFDFLGLPDGDGVGEGEGFDFRRDGGALAAADGFVWLGDEEAGLGAVLDEVAEGGEGDVSGGDEGDFQNFRAG